jgi:hypothetical protein
MELDDVVEEAARTTKLVPLSQAMKRLQEELGLAVSVNRCARPSRLSGAEEDIAVGLRSTAAAYVENRSY